ncbi:PREDICTED: nucleic-acid-binding protein from mobile element jockey-like [Dufourea novaeangliae]|uniref:nucleic-acid-binding protein from mobile element jockey-like n=1 Tax=Dufourea novaeangliae TaxID=178035 RepID=UPI000766E4A2|nr:PREDICTED: nucleic-acid-binding protein from mobile element jockey-like [Dufourea novaeangliae]
MTQSKQQDTLRLKIAKTGDKFLIRNNPNVTNCMDIDYEKETDKQSNSEYRPVHNKKRKVIIPDNHNITNSELLQQDKWLSNNIPLTNLFSLLPEVSDEPSESVNKETPQPKPPPIHIEAQIIEPLLDLLKETADNKYTMKQLQNNQVKIQADTTDIYNKSYKVVLRGMHPKTNTNRITEELKELNHKVRQINNIVKYDTKQQLPLFFIELEPNVNNKEIYKIDRLLNTVISFEPPKKKRDIPQCMRCQTYGHTRNYCNKTPACVKCAGKHLTSKCSLERKIENVKCCNCQGNHPASYKGCIIRKQLQQKMYPALRQRALDSNSKNTTQNHIPNHNNNDKTRQINTTNKSYAQALSPQIQSQSYLPNQNNDTDNETSEIKNLLIQSTKNTELIANMLLEQTKLLQQQTQQINAMIQLLTNMISNNKK